MPRSFLCALLLSAPLLAQAPAERELERVPGDRRQGLESIDLDLCKQWLTYLASDEMEGRETGHPGYKKAADFIAQKFKEFGLKPVGDKGTYFQAVPFQMTRALADKTRLILHSDGEKALTITPDDGLGGTINEASQRKFGLVVCVINDAEAFAKLELGDLADKALILIDRVSGNGARFTPAMRRLWRLRPGATIRVNDALAKRPISESGRVSYAGGGVGRFAGRRRRPNSYAITATLAKRILAKAGQDAAIVDDKKSTRVVVCDGCALEAKVEIETKPVFGANVVGFLEGRDPELKKEIVGIGSHLDHIGRRGNQINNGADDDGSGTTGVLAVARAFTQNKKRPRRSILFMCFSGEEKGLIGSRYYTENPIFPNKSMVAELQMDMIGRNEERINRRTGEVIEKAEDNVNSLHLVGTQKLSKDLHETCLRINKSYVGFDFEYDEENVFSRSDHANFARKNIPIAFFFTGFHPQYHRPDDTVDKINFPKLVRVAKLCYLVGWDVAERVDRPKVDRTFEEAMRAAGRRRR